MKIESIPPQHYPDYRMDVMFDGYKWDLQAGEQSTISDNVLLMEYEDAKFLADHAVKLYHETIKMERALHNNPKVVPELGISKKMADALCNCKYDPSRHIRFMRFDFHPTTGGWQISEVNSDVPAGYPEASVLPALALRFFNGYRQFGCFGEVMKRNLTRLVPRGSAIAYLHDTHTVEDYQILHYIGDMMEQEGYGAVYASPENISWDNGKAYIKTQELGAIIRYFPVEWMEFSKNVDWCGFVGTKIPSCNHPIALLTQSKRLPLVWDALGVDVPTWKKLLPETRDCDNIVPNGWILKPAFGRVGEGINIPGTMSEEEESEIKKAAKVEPTQWVMQKMFESKLIDGMHVNIGVFVMDSEFAGFYARISSEARIDEDASEIPILVKG